jgi:hypothetical protein
LEEVISIVESPFLTYPFLVQNKNSFVEGLLVLGNKTRSITSTIGVFFMMHMLFSNNYIDTAI